MATERANDLKAFLDFARAKLTSGEVDVTLDEVLARWEYENETDAEREDTLRAIREGLDDMHAGRTRPAEEVFAEIRQKFRPGNR